MTIGQSTEILLIQSPGHSGLLLRLGITLIITLMVVSSPIVMLINPVLGAAFSYSPTSPSPSPSSPLRAANAIPSAPSTISQDGKDGDFTTQAALGSLSVRPTNDIVNRKAFYDIVFVTATSGAIKRIQVTFPAGTGVPSSASFNEAEKCVPSGNCTMLAGTVSKSGQTLTYTVTNAVNVPAGTKIRLEFANIVNPITPNNAYHVTVSTRNAANAVIDGPTQSTGYLIQQIGTNAIANNAITTPKIADGAVTTAKIASGSIVPSVIERNGPTVSVTPSTIGSSIADCLDGERVVGGGYFMSYAGPYMLQVYVEEKFGTEDSWYVIMFNPDSIAHSFTSLAECMPALP